MPVTEHAQNITPNTDTVTDKHEVPPDISDLSFLHFSDSNKVKVRLSKSMNEKIHYNINLFKSSRIVRLVFLTTLRHFG